MRVFLPPEGEAVMIVVISPKSMATFADLGYGAHKEEIAAVERLHWAFRVA